MFNMRLVRVLSAILLGALCVHAIAAADDRATSRTEETSEFRRWQALNGPSIQVDPGFNYYQGRSAASIADEIVENRYNSVHYFVTNEEDVDRGLIDAFHARGLQVWALVLGNGSYSVDGWPSQWPEWQMKLVGDIDDGFFRFSPFSKDYVEFKKQRLAKLVKTYPFDGLEIAESYLPDWDGFASGYYGDVGPLAAAAFKQQYGKEMPNFTDPKSSLYYKTDQHRYQQWVQFRVDGVNQYQDEIVNGLHGVRATRSILVGTWSLGIDAGPDSVAQEREIQGLDAAAMITAVRPDIHFIQTNWPDWLNPDLASDYAKTYLPFVEQIRARHPMIPLGIQADIGSGPLRDRAWITNFAATAKRVGFNTWTAYEYSIGGYMYVERPTATHALCHPDSSTVTVSFQKRIDPASATKPGSFVIINGTDRRAVDPKNVTVDGNIAVLHQPKLPSGNFRISISHVTDAPQFWVMNNDAQPHEVASGLRVEGSCSAM